MKKFNPEVDDLNGVLLVNKPEGLTSHDVVDRIRRHFALRKVGHAGTLDPLATGLLVVAIGKGTKLTNQLITDNKEYRATCLLGVETETQDIQGNVVKEMPTESVSEADVQEVVLSFKGAQEQIPPMYSAKKKNGRKLYELARSGIEVEREPKPIVIHDIRLEKTELPTFQIFVSCSKGTYIRTLCHDIGKKLSCGGTLTALSRISSGAFHLSESVSLDELLAGDTEFLKSILIPLSKLKEHANSETI